LVTILALDRKETLPTSVCNLLLHWPIHFFFFGAVDII
jgi:hypothetical protein